MTVNPHAIDIAGRHGVAFTMSLIRGVRLQIVLDSHDYQFMGYSVVAAPGNRP